MHAWLLRERETLSRSSEVLKPMNYMLRRWADFAASSDDGRICLSNNAAERALRGIALGTAIGPSPAACAAPTAPLSC
nr:transposase [Bradyrhizobium vignae]